MDCRSLLDSAKIHDGSLSKLLCRALKKQGNYCSSQKFSEDVSSFFLKEDGIQFVFRTGAVGNVADGNASVWVPYQEIWEYLTPTAKELLKGQ